MGCMYFCKEAHGGVRIDFCKEAHGGVHIDFCKEAHGGVHIDFCKEAHGGVLMHRGVFGQRCVEVCVDSCTERCREGMHVGSVALAIIDLGGDNREFKFEPYFEVLYPL